MKSLFRNVGASDAQVDALLDKLKAARAYGIAKSKRNLIKRKNEINTYELNSHTYEFNINNGNAKEENNINLKIYKLNNGII